MMCNIDAEVDLDDADGVISEDNKEDNVCIGVAFKDSEDDVKDVEDADGMGC